MKCYGSTPVSKTGRLGSIPSTFATKQRLQPGTVVYDAIDKWFYCDEGCSWRYVEWKPEREVASMHQMDALAITANAGL